jgi:sporulation protein YlmC with PRC-barrel domain
VKRSLKEIVGYSMQAKDGTKGNVKDFFFDDKEWNVKYVEIDLGIVFSGRKVLIPRVFLSSPDRLSRGFMVELSKSDIENCPLPDEHPLVSQEYEKVLKKYLSQIAIHRDLPCVGSGAIMNTPKIRIDESDLESCLRSFNAIIGYHIKAIDGDLGHVCDIIIDDKDWQIVYAVVDTSNWLPWSKQVIISIRWMEEISYVDKQITVNLHVEDIKSAPEFIPSEPINEVFEKHLYDYYGQLSTEE